MAAATPSSFTTAHDYPFTPKSALVSPFAQDFAHFTETPQDKLMPVAVEPIEEASKCSSSNSERPSLPEGSIHTSVRLQDTETEGKPSIYLFIFVNPLSGDQKGADLIQLPIQHFRLRRLPQVQVEIHNILDAEDREKGLEQVMLIQTMAKLGKIPPIPDDDEESEEGIHASPSSPSDRASKSTGSSTSKSTKTPKSAPEANGRLSKTVRTRQIHVWSAGGDGTVMSVFEMLVGCKIDLDLIFFSCIPFGTGNDFSQVLGWGRTIPNKDLLGTRLQNLESLICDRLEKAEAARLDIWQIEMESHPGGYVRQAGPKNRKDGHDVAEVKGDKEVHDPVEGDLQIVRKMCNYMSIGVQGYVGSGFEEHRAGKRLANMLVYTSESSKWVFWRRFPSVTEFIDSIVQNGKQVLRCPSPAEAAAAAKSNNASATSVSTDSSPLQPMPEMTKHPIDFVIQNIPHIWGREVDLWGEAESGLEVVKDRNGPTDPKTWKPQRANDGRLEILVIDNMMSYIKKLANIRSHVSRIGQFSSPFEIRFREPPSTSKKHKSMMASMKHRWGQRKRNKYEKKNVICLMCDGEFYDFKDPKSMRFELYAQIWTLGRSDEEEQGRLVQDEIGQSQDTTA
ncbi:ATP-NAD kinase-like domain-containing protein [Radiomyces spectabilis]|uniref:ATP-NAD kinase-like domain-containing protein n=1 Tax=Radiomyces spectabilis TaxID=64574 RepID=UPI00221E5FE1|nr:ATP-NAD kinase-like domain-containing protein [Radiomyces spectabilis]KAI8393995.1 ATP-NAD kinase-like domain-containing protein [Radiomyces spectabilis]